MLVKANSQQRPDKVDILSKGEDSANNFAVDHPVAQSCGKLCQCGGGSSSTMGTYSLMPDVAILTEEVNHAGPLVQRTAQGHASQMVG